MLVLKDVSLTMMASDFMKLIDAGKLKNQYLLASLIKLYTHWQKFKADLKSRLPSENIIMVSTSCLPCQ